MVKQLKTMTDRDIGYYNKIEKRLHHLQDMNSEFSKLGTITQDESDYMDEEYKAVTALIDLGWEIYDKMKSKEPFSAEELIYWVATVSNASRMYTSEARLFTLLGYKAGDKCCEDKFLKYCREKRNKQ